MIYTAVVCGFERYKFLREMFTCRIDGYSAILNSYEEKCT